MSPIASQKMTKDTVSPRTSAPPVAPFLLSIGSLREIAAFLGRSIVVRLSLGIVTSISFFAVEIAFAISIQALLLHMANSVPGASKLPLLIPPNRLSRIIIWIALSGLLRVGLSWANVYLQWSLPARFGSLQRTRLLQWTFRSKSVSHSRMMELFNERMNTCGTMIRSCQETLVQATMALFLGATLFFVCAPITSIAVTFLVLLAFPIRWLSFKLRVASQGVLEDYKKLNSRLSLSIRNLLLLRVYGMQSHEHDLAKKSLANYIQHVLNSVSITGLVVIAPQFVGVLLICIIAAAAKTRFGMSPEGLVSYLYLLMRFTQSVSGAVNGGSNVILYAPQMRDFFAWYRDFETSERQTAKALFLQPEMKGGIISSPIGWRLRGINFSYPESHHAVLSDFNLEIKPGSTVVIVGPSGVGKSTLVNLLLGQVAPNAGTIEVMLPDRGYPIQQVESQLLSTVGYVGPESFLTEGTIYENIMYGVRTTPTAAELEIAIEKSECQFIYKFTKGLQHYLSDQGQGMSAGQKQRLSLLRALLRKPRALILDEATSNLDNETERKLVDTLATLKSQLTIIAVTHRQELLRICDQEIRLKARSARDLSLGSG